VLLHDQDRALWDPDAIAEGRRLVVPALTGPGVGPYAVQAAIAALHDEAPDVASTDWPQIVALYDVLLRLTPSPLVALNRAMAVAMADGAAAGLALVDELADAPELRGYHLLPATRGELLARLGRTAEAALAYGAAIGLAANASERVTLHGRLAALVRG
jgi:RNA polymerase sigma-70 factor (ECF subfamily)